jgi:glycosyltransferase involved in cell wall biosynthesis
LVQNMRIGLLIYDSLDILTGGYLYDRMMVAKWREMGDEVVIFSLPNKGYWGNYAGNFNTTFYQQLLHADIDILIQDELCYPSIILLNRLLRGRVSYPIVSLIHLLRFTEQRPAWQNRVYRWLEKFYLQSVAGFIYNSHDSRKLVEGLVGNVAGVVAYPGRDHLTGGQEEGETRGGGEGGIRLITVGNVVARKGLHTILGALELVGREDWVLTVVGGLDFERDYVARMRAVIERWGFGDKVRLVGKVANGEMPAFLTNSDLFILVSQYEAFGIVYLEAMAHGLPIIASTAGAAGEMVRHGVEGWLVPPDDPVALAEVLQTAMADKDGLRKMGENGVARVKGFPTWGESAVVIRKFLALQVANLEYGTIVNVD